MLNKKMNTENVILLFFSIFLIKYSMQNRIAPITTIKSTDASSLLYSYNNKLFSFISYLDSEPELYEYDRDTNSFTQIEDYCSLFLICHNTNLLIYAKYFEEQKRNVFIFVKTADNKFYINIILDNPYREIEPSIRVKLNTIPYITFFTNDILIISLKAYFGTEYRLSAYQITISNGTKNHMLTSPVINDCYIQCEGVSEEHTYCGAIIGNERTLQVPKASIYNASVYLDPISTIKVDNVNGFAMKKGKRMKEGKLIDALVILLSTPTPKVFLLLSCLSIYT